MAKKVPRLIDVTLDEVILRTFILFVQTAETVLKYSDEHFYRKAGLSVIKHMVLQILAHNGGTMTSSQLAEWTFRERHTITALVERMKRDGLLSTKHQSIDKRFVDIKLTAKGREVLEQATPVARDIVNQVMVSISEEDAVCLEKALGLLRRNAHDGLVNLKLPT